MRKSLNKLLAAGVAGSLLLASAAPSFALPASNGQALSQAAPAATENVRWRHHGRWIGPAIGLGILGLGIAAATAPRYYDYDYAYGPPYGYYDPYYYGGCWRDYYGRLICR